MNTLEKQDIEQFKNLIDSVRVANGCNVIFLAYSESHAKMIEEIMPGVTVLRINEYLETFETNNNVYIIPCEYKPIKFTCKD